MERPVPVTSVETLPTELLEWLGERKIKPGEGDFWLSHAMHWAAMQGSVEVLEFLLAQGASPDAHDTDPTSGLIAYPLHWAAINGRLMFCKVLLDNGAQVDSRGGELNATPMMWAAKYLPSFFGKFNGRNGHVYIVHLLLQYGGDPLLADSQGFNVLHLATHSSNIMLILYLLHQPHISPDLSDPQDHTPIMWAAYQGDALSVDVLLRWGADVKKRDQSGLTALHWAVVRGNKMCMRRLIEEGADIKALMNDGRSPFKLAEDMKCSLVLQRALEDSGRYSQDGAPRLKPRFSNDLAKKIMFCAPCVIIWIALVMLSSLPFYLSSWMVPGWLFGSYSLVQKFILKDLHGANGQVHRTPYLAGIFSGTAVLVALRWAFKILPKTFPTHPFLNIAFAVVFATSMYCFTQAVVSDPGYIPRPGGISEQKKIVEELVVRGELDARHFCTSCFVRKSLRSKHCRICDRCVARHDHHCPWVNNCVGVRTHRSFVSYVTLLQIGIPMYIYLAYLHISALDLPPNPECKILWSELCEPLVTDPYTTLLTIWTAAQLIWITLLVTVQYYQIGRGITTHEMSNLQKYGFLGGDQVTVEDRMQEGVSSRLPAIAKPHSPPLGRFNKCLRILGVEQFFETFKDKRQRAVAQRRGMNPFDQGGCWTNCGDFWANPAHVSDDSAKGWLDNGLDFRGIGFRLGKGGEGRLGGEEVNYFDMWEVPEKKRRRRVVDQEYEGVAQVDEDAV